MILAESVENRSKMELLYQEKGIVAERMLGNER